MPSKYERAALHRHRLSKIAEQIDECGLDHTETDVREAARYLGIEHYLPEVSQEELDLR
jgi:hypothetical protein